MNAAEVMMLREDAADGYLTRIDQRFAERYPDNVEVAMMIKLCWEDSREGECTINEALAQVISYLDDLDNDDAFGTWGWRHNVMGED